MTGGFRELPIDEQDPPEFVRCSGCERYFETVEEEVCGRCQEAICPDCYSDGGGMHSDCVEASQNETVADVMARMQTQLDAMYQQLNENEPATDRYVGKVRNIAFGSLSPGQKQHLIGELTEEHIERGKHAKT